MISGCLYISFNKHMTFHMNIKY